MAVDKNDNIELSFNLGKFHDDINKASKGLDNFAKNTEAGMKKMGKNTENISGKMFKAMFKMEALKFGLSKASQLIKSFINEIPEIGQTFDIAKKMFMKEFLYPVRQVLIPFLQKILNWAKESRGMFLKWGTVAANAVKGIIAVIKVAYTLFQSFMKGFTQGKDLTNFFNVLIFKITAMIMLAEIKLRPFFESLGNLIRNVIGSLKEFGEGFASAFNGTDVDILKSISDLLKELSFNADGTKSAFFKLGEFIGNVFVGTLELLASTMTGIANLIKVVKGEMTLEESQYKTMEAAKNYKTKEFLYADLGKTYAQKLEELKRSAYPDAKKDRNFDPGGGRYNGVKVKKQNDFIITKKGEVVSTHADDTIIGTKTPEKLSGGGKTSITFGEISINLTVTEGNSKAAGQNFAQGLGSQLRIELMNKMMLQGQR